MKVLIKKTNQIQEVKDSYAVNYLIPKGLAVVATDKVVRDVEQKLANTQAQTQEKKKRQQDLAREFDGKTFTMTERATQEGNLYASIGNNQIKKLFKTKEPVEIITRDPIKRVGEYDIEVKIGGNRSKVRIIVEKGE